MVYILSQDASKIKDNKEQTKLLEMQRELKQKYCKNNNKEITQEERENIVSLYKELGLLKGGN